VAIDKISGTSQVNRDIASEGHERIAKSEAQPRNEKLDQVAKLYEKQFLREMVKSMRGTVSYGYTKPSMAEEIYRGELDNEYVEAWGENGGIGLSSLIYDQIMERYFSTPQGRGLKEQGPIALTDRDVSKVVRIKTAPTGETANQVPLRVEIKPSAEGAPGKLQLPWDAQVVSKNQVGGKTSLTLSHGEGLKSTFIFQGVASADVEPGKQLGRGQTVGILSPEVRAFFWNLSQSSARPGAKLDAGLVKNE
jgi:flagellar protein FlgJ